MHRAGRLIAVLAGALWPAAALAQRLGGGGQGADVSILRVLAALAVCLAAAFALALVLKSRKQPGSWRFAPGWLARTMTGSSRIDVVETRRLSSFADICLMRCDGVEYLLVCGPSGHRVLRRAALDNPAE